MKNIGILFASTGIFSFLFYDTYLGLNLGIFTLSMLILLAANNPLLLQNRAWKLFAFCTLISAITVCYIGNALSIFTNIVSLLLVIGISDKPRATVLFSLITGFYSIISSAIRSLIDLTDHLSKPKPVSNSWKKVIQFSIPLFITFIFFLMYKNANSVFDNFTKRFNFDWLTIGLILCTLLGFIISYGFFRVPLLKKLDTLDANTNMTISENDSKELIFGGKLVSVGDETYSAKILFIMLNVLLLIVNTLDFNFAFIDSSLPKNVTLSEFLHQGVGMLVISIAISICIILFYFRGQLNFIKKNKSLKLLAYAWIIQNIFMLFTVCIKNSMYVTEYGLTYKRIGIFVYVSLTLIGLITTLIKVNKAKTNMYLLRINGALFYILLLVLSMVNWDKQIVQYNTNGNREYDLFYLESLSVTNIPYLLKIESEITDIEERKAFHAYLTHKMDVFCYNHKADNWKAWNYLDAKLKTSNFYKTVNSKIK